MAQLTASTPLVALRNKRQKYARAHEQARRTPHLVCNSRRLDSASATAIICATCSAALPMLCHQQLGEICKTWAMARALPPPMVQAHLRCKMLACHCDRQRSWCFAQAKQPRQLWVPSQRQHCQACLRQRDKSYRRAKASLDFSDCAIAVCLPGVAENTR